MTKHAWNDNNYEGKLIRYGINKIAKKLKISDDTDEIIKLLNAISTASNAKANLAKYEHLDKKLDHVLQLLKHRELKVINLEAVNDLKQLPGQPDQ